MSVVPRASGGLSAARATSPQAASFALPRGLLAVPLPILFLLAWQFATSGKAYSLIPPPTTVALTIWDFAFGGIYDYAYSHTFLTHAVASISRVFLGFGIAMVAAIPLGIVLGRNTTVSAVLDPSLQFLRPIPVTAWLPLAMILFGVGPRATVALIALGAFFPMLINTVEGVKFVEPRLLEAAQMLGTPKTAIFSKIILPAASPNIFTGIRIGLGFSWVLLVVGEMTGVPQGLGAAIMDARNLSRTDLVIAGMIFIGAIGFCSDRLVVSIGRRTLWWNPNARA